MLNGTVRADALAIPGAVVLLCARDPDRVLAAAETDAGGGFLLHAPDPPRDAGVLVTLRGSIVAAGWWTLAELDGGEALDLPGPFHRLDVALNDAKPAPGGAVASIEPLGFAAVPDALAPLLGMRSPTLIDFRFASRPLDGGRASFRVAPGTYVIGAGVPVPDGPQLAAGSARGWVAGAARVGDRELRPYGAHGFRLAIDGDVTVEVELRETESYEDG